MDLSRQLIPHSVRISFISVIRAIRGQFQYDEVGTRLEARRCDLDLDGWFNNLSQLTHLTCGGQLNIIGSVSTSNAYVLVQGKTNEPPFYPNPGTNWLGAATVSAGSNSIPIVAWEGTNSSRANLTVYMPPSNPQIFTYDLNGSLTAEGQRTYQWTEENRLKEIETSAAATAIGIPKRKSVYTYDGMGRRIGKTDLANWSDGAYCTTNVQTFIYDGWLLVREQSASGGNVTTNQYIWGLDLSQSLQGAGGIGGLLCVIRNGERYFPVYCGNGNISDYLDQTGAVVAHYEYDPFGRTVAATGALKDAFSFRFSTKYYEPFWKLYYYGLRYYSPEISRWLNRDPIGEQAFLSRYSDAKFAACLAKNPRDGEECVYRVTDEIRSLKQETIVSGLSGFVRNNPVNHSDMLGLGSANNAPVGSSPVSGLGSANALGPDCKILLMVGHWTGFVKDWPLNNPNWYKPCYRWGPMSCYTADARDQGNAAWHTTDWQIGGWEWFEEWLYPTHGSVPASGLEDDDRVLSDLVGPIREDVLKEMQSLCDGGCCCKQVEVEVNCLISNDPTDLGPGDYWDTTSSQSGILKCGTKTTYTCPVNSL